MEKVVLKQEILKKLSRDFKKFTNILEDNCMVYAFFRGELYSNNNGCVCLDLLASTDTGALRRVDLELDENAEKIFLSKKFKLIDTDAVRDALIKLVLTIQELPKPVSKVYFEFCPGFSQGRIEEDPKEPGSIIMYLMGARESKEHSFCLSSAVDRVGKDLAGSWDAEE